MPDGSAIKSYAARGAVAAAAIFATLMVTIAAAQEAAAPPETPSARGGGHFSAPDPAALTPERATAIYRDIREQMVAGYRLSGNRAARNFTRWERFNSAPYRSANHGHRYVNNYANAAAAEAYRQYEAARVLPSGAVIVKDMFYVSQSGGVFPGALMIMEKMESGFNDETGDWRFTMIMPDGSLFGTTGGESAQSVEFCGTCHALAAANDYLFFVPRAFRVGTE